LKSPKSFASGGAACPRSAWPHALGLDPKTVRRYITVAEGTGLRVGGDALSETQLRDVLLALDPGGGRPRGEDWDRFAVIELGFGRSAPTMPVADGEPGEELQLDTGWVGWLTPRQGR
jgi:hypothetical protein